MAKEKEIYEVPQLKNWNDLTEEVSGLPQVVAVALMTGRSEMLKIYGKVQGKTGQVFQKRLDLPLTLEETSSLLHLIGVLMDTNHALQTHCKHLAGQVSQARQLVYGVTNKLQDLEHWANFQNSYPPEDEASA